MEKSQEVFCLGEGLYRLVQTSGNGAFVDSYLILGSRSALLVDLQRDRGSLLETVRSLTDLPLEAAVTHAHEDHLGENAADFFAAGIPVWIFEEELSLFEHPLYREKAPAGGRYRFLRDGMRFDLGGTVLEVGSVTGHTPRGCMLLEREKGWLFTGDALGNRSFWMHVPLAADLGTFRESLGRYLPQIEGVDGLKVFTGHGIGESCYGKDWIGAVAGATDAILSGAAAGEQTEHRFGPCRLLRTEVFPEGFFYREAES